MVEVSGDVPAGRSSPTPEPTKSIPRALGQFYGRSVLVQCPLGCALVELAVERCYGSNCDGQLGDGILLLSLEEALFLLCELDVLEFELSLEIPGAAPFQGQEIADRIFAHATLLVPQFPQRYAAYRHFRLKGWVVRPDALKFGADFLLYDGRIDEVHSRYEVLLVGPQVTWSDVQANARVAQAVNKDLLLTVVGESMSSSDVGSETRWSSLSAFLRSPDAAISEAVARRWHPHAGDAPKARAG